METVTVRLTREQAARVAKLIERRGPRSGPCYEALRKLRVALSKDTTS